MSVEHDLLEVVASLSPEEKKKVMEFARALNANHDVERTRKPLRGICRDMAVSVTPEEISEARREMWASFPRDFPE